MTELLNAFTDLHLKIEHAKKLKTQEGKQQVPILISAIN